MEWHMVISRSPWPLWRLGGEEVPSFTGLWTNLSSLLSPYS